MNSYSKISTDRKKQEQIIERLESDSEKDNIPIIDREVGLLLKSMVFLHKPKSILEIGCGIGYSTYFLLINSLDTYYLGIDMNKERLQKADTAIKKIFNEKNIEFKSGNALKIMPELKNKFDLVFIDGTKLEYPLYLEKVLNLVSKGSVIIADNVFYQDKLFKKDLKKHDKNSVLGLRKFIAMIENNKNLDTLYLDISDGISISILK